MTTFHFDMIFAVTFSAALAGLALSASALPFSDDQAVRAIVGETASHPGAMLAIAGAIRNRGTLEGVQGANARHNRRESETTFALARSAWAVSRTNDASRGATHWFSGEVQPGWAVKMKVTAKIGPFTFLK